jgi:glycosyl transferase family 4
MVSDHGCIRVFKEAIALQKRGHVVDVAARGELFGRNQMDTFSMYLGPDQLKRVVASSKADVIHVHNEPDWLVPCVREATNKPVIFDVHDLESLRWNREPDKIENAAFDAADGIVHISEGCKAVADKYHGESRPAAILPCYINEGFLAQELPTPCMTSLVYEGGLATTSQETAKDGLVGHNIRGLEVLVSAFYSQGFQVHMFPAGNPPPVGHYENLGAVVHGGLPFPSLLRAIRVYGFGFVGATFSSPLMEAAMPNKLFEYISQGVIPVVWNASAAAEFVRNEGIGIAIDGLDDLQDRLLTAADAIRNRLIRERFRFTMENHIGAIETLYEEAEQVRRAA